MASYATDRKIKLLEQHFGRDWRNRIGDQRIDAAYNRMVGDTRANLFCKVLPRTKAKLAEMVDDYDIKMSEFIETLIRNEYERFRRERTAIDADLAKQFAG